MAALGRETWAARHRGELRVYDVGDVLCPDASRPSFCSPSGSGGNPAPATGSVPNLMPNAIEHPAALDAVSHLYALGLSTTAEEVARVLDHRGAGPVDTAALRDALEELADKRELGRIQTAPHEKGRELRWTTSYFPVANILPGATTPAY